MNSKKRLLIIVGDYLPNPSPNSNCLEKILECLPEWEITILTSYFDKMLPDKETIGNITILRVFDWIKAWYKKEWNHLRFAEKEVKKIVNYIISRFSFPDNKVVYRITGKKYIFQIKDQFFDVVISIGLPFTDHVLAEKYYQLNKKTQWIVYMLDPYSDNKNIIKKGIIYRIFAQRAEDRILNRCSAIIAVFGIKINERFQDKLYRTGIPLLVPKVKNDNLKEDKIGIFYGGLIKGIREPEDVLRILQEVKKLYPEYCFYFFTKINGYFSNLLKKYSEVEHVITLHDYVSKNELEDIVARSEILINIGNIVSNQVPSKIFEYISWRKPILHFYSIDNDSSIPYLENYPNVCIIDTRKDKKKSAEEIKSFLLSKHNSYSFDSLLEKPLLKASTPEYTANIIRKLSDLA